MLSPVPVPSQAIHSRTGWNLHYSDIQSTAQKSPCVNTFLRPLQKLHEEPICARLRKLRVVLQELEQDDDEVVTPRPETQHCGHEQNKSANLGKRAA